MTSKFIERYKEELVNRLKRAGYPKDRITNAMLKVEERITETYTVEPVEIFNNIKNVKFSLDTEKLIDLILFSPSKPIITGYNTLFHNHKKIENIPGSFLDYLKQERGKAKNKAFEHINDEDRSLYNNHNTLQLILKLLANSYYGAFGQSGFHFYNPMLGPSVTSQGRQLISASIVAFEGLLGDNISFYDSDEVTNFLDNILQEAYDEEEILEPLIQITPELVKSRIRSKCEFELTTGFNSYLDQVVSSVPLTVLQKIYYKNNFYEFIEIPDIKEAISENLIRDDFFDPNKPPEDIADILRAIYETVHYFVAYPYPYNRKTHRVSTMYRKTVLVCDTDSNFILVYPWLEFVCKTKGLVIDELTTEERVSIISSITYIFSEFIKETFAIFNTNSNVPETEFHRIDMKSELILYVAHYKLY